MPRSLLLFLFLAVGPILLSAQKYLQIETRGRAATEKFPVGSYLEYQVEGDDFFSQGELIDLLPESQTLVMEDRYLSADRIVALRFERPFGKAAAYSLYTFGVAWSGFALIGYNTDNDPSTQYSLGDAVVTATSLGLGYLIQKTFSQRKVRLGKNKKKRLRLIDTTF
jgi:hypothetical protein